MVLGSRYDHSKLKKPQRRLVAVEAKRTYRFCTDLLFDEFLNFNCTRLKIQIDAKHCWLEILKWQHFWNLSLIISYPGGQVQVTQCGHLSRYFSCSFKGWKPEARAADLVAADCGESGGSLDPVGSLALQILWKAASLVLGWLGFCEDTRTLPTELKPLFVVQERFYESKVSSQGKHWPPFCEVLHNDFFFALSRDMLA